MTRLILLTVAALVASPAPAQIYGTSDGGCERAAGNPINDLDAYFDGKTLAGQDWCDLTPAGPNAYHGTCDSDVGGDSNNVAFTVVPEGDKLTILAVGNDHALVMQRCK